MDELDAAELLRNFEIGGYGQVLHSSPMKAALSVPFPMLVIEGKSYGTGRTWITPRRYGMRASTT